jgi:AraC family transcriptional regulator, arabinose operon regulatory protein
MESRRATRIADGFPGQRMVVLPRPAVADALARPITADLLVTDVGFFPSAAQHYIERLRGVPQAIAIYCVGGEGWAELAGCRHVIARDRLLIVPPGCAHSYGAGAKRPWSIYWCHAGGRNVPHLLEAMGISPQRPVIQVADSAGQVPLIDEALSALERGFTQVSLLVASLAMGHFFGRILADPGGGAVGVDRDQRIEQIIEFMRQSVGTAVHVRELSAMARLSPSHFAAMFKHRTGYAPLDFFARLKMREACRLLDTTTLPIKQIAARLGYDDPLYFSRAFKKIVAMAPRGYRAIRKG